VAGADRAAVAKGLRGARTRGPDPGLLAGGCGIAWTWIEVTSMHEERPTRQTQKPAQPSPEQAAEQAVEQAIQHQDRKDYHQIEAVAVAGGMATGALAGAVAGPPGAVVGAVVVGVVSAVTCLVLDREERRDDAKQIEMDRQAAIDDETIARRASAKQDASRLEAEILGSDPPKAT
jgi:hypothetical protein